MENIKKKQSNYSQKKRDWGLSIFRYFKLSLETVRTSLPICLAVLDLSYGCCQESW